MKTTPPPDSKALRVAFGAAAVFAAVTFGVLHMWERPAAGPAGAQVRHDQGAAQGRVQALPELQAWAGYIERRSGGRARGAIIAGGNAPRMVGGAPYWSFDFVENHAQQAQRWETFLMAPATGDIYVEDQEAGRLLTLAQWRARKPLDRIKG